MRYKKGDTVWVIGYSIYGSIPVDMKVEGYVDGKLVVSKDNYEGSYKLDTEIYPVFRNYDDAYRSLAV